MNQNSEGIYLTPFQRQLLVEKIAQEPHNAYRQRLEVILLTDRGETQAAICRTLGCSPGTASRWIQLTKAGLAHQYLDCPVGRPKVVIDLLDVEERLWVKAQLGDCPDLAQVLVSYQASVELMPYSAPTVPMAADLKDRLFERLNLDPIPIPLQP